MIGNDKLTELIGSWAGEESLLASAWGAAGTAEGTLRFTPAPAGGLLVDYAETREGTITLTGHGVLCADAWWWFDSYGFIPHEPGDAHWDDATLVLSRKSERGRSVMRLWLDGAELQMLIDSAVPADAELIPMLKGRYRRR